MALHPTGRFDTLTLGGRGNARDTDPALLHGTGVPSGGTVQGSGQALTSGQPGLYLRRDPAGSDSVAYVTHDGGTTWTALLTAAGGGAGHGSTVVPLIPIAAQQALSGAGAINVTTYYTAWTTTAADAGTLADGVQIGQLKKIQLIVDGGDGTLTPVSLSGGTTITFADAGDYVVLCWNGTAWVAIELGNDADGATAPVVA